MSSHSPFSVVSLLIPVIFIAAIPDDVRHYPKEIHFLFKRHDALVLRIVHLARPVITQYVPEDIRITVKEKLLGFFIIEEVPLVGAKQGVWVLLQGVLPRLEGLSTDVDANSLVGGDPRAQGGA